MSSNRNPRRRLFIVFARVAMTQEIADSPTASVQIDAGQITRQPHAGKRWATVRVTGSSEYSFTAEATKE